MSLYINKPLHKIVCCESRNCEGDDINHCVCDRARTQDNDNSEVKNDCGCRTSCSLLTEQQTSRF